jgi:RNA polymerase sigma factor (sigma-70 family)
VRLVGGSDADDLVQDVWIAALQRPPARPGVRGWLRAVAHKLAARGHRSAQRRSERERIAGERATEIDPELVRRHRALAEAVLALEEPHRSAIALRYYEGLDYGELARRLGVSEVAARRRVSRACDVLRARLAPERAPALFLGPVACAEALAMKGKLLLAASALGAVGVGFVMWPAWFGARALSVASAGLEVGREAAPAVPDAEPLGPAEPPVERAPIAAGALAAEWRGRVVDAHGRALAGAALRLVDRDGAVLDGDRDAAVSTAEGEFALRTLETRQRLGQDVPQDVPLFARVTLEHHAPVVQRVDEARSARIVLPRWPRLLGHLWTRAHEPIVTPATVRVAVIDGADARHEHECEAAGGAFAFEALPPGRLVRLVARARGAATTTMLPELDLRLDATAELDVVLASGAVVTGVVLDEESGTPLPGALVWCGPGGQPEATDPRAVADGAGRFVLEGVEPARLDEPSGAIAVFSLRASTPAHASSPTRAHCSRWCDEGRYEFEVRLPRAESRVDGEVLEQDGTTPAAGLWVHAIDARANHVTVATDGDGRFTLDHRAAGSCVILARAPELEGAGGGRATRIVAELLPGANPVRMVLSEPRAAIGGSVRGEDGNAVAGVEVELTLQLEVEGLRMSLDSRRVTTDATGRYLFAALPASQFEIAPRTAADGGLLCARPGSSTLEVEPSEQRTDVDFTVLPGMVVRGTVTTSGFPREQIELRLCDRDGRIVAATNVDEGEFDLGVVPTAEYELRLTREDRVVLRRVVAVEGGDGLTLEVR